METEIEIDWDKRFKSVEQAVVHQDAQLTEVTARLDQLTALLKQLVQPQASAAVPPLPNPQPTSETSAPSPKKDSQSSRNTRPAVPNSFNGDRKSGRAFFNSVTLYMSVCGKDFADDDARILWVLSYMNEGRAAVFVDAQIRKYNSNVRPFADFAAFRDKFIAEFYPLTEKEDSLNLILARSHVQGNRSVEEYVDSFNVLVQRAGLTDGLSITTWFRQGLDPEIRTKVGTMQNRPEYEDYDGWVRAARIFDQDRRTNAAFGASQRRQAPNVPIQTRPVNTFPNRPNILPRLSVPAYQPPPFPPPRPVAPMTAPTPFRPPAPTSSTNSDAMEVDAAQRRLRSEPVRCFRCGQNGHLACTCPQAYDIRFVQADEVDDFVMHLLARKDALEAESQAQPEVPEEDLGVAPTASEDFQKDNE